MPDTFTLAVFLGKFSVLAAALTQAGLGWAVALGGALGRRARPVWGIAAASVTGLGYALLLLATNAQLGGAWASALDPATFSWIWPGRQAQMVVLGLGLVVAIAGAVARWRMLGLTAAILIGASFALSGHASGLQEEGLFAMISVALHGVASSFWFVAPLLLWPRRDRLDVSAVQQLITAKFVIALLALGLGAVNKQFVSRKLVADPTQGRRLLRVTLGVDAMLFLTALALVTWVTTVTGPPS